MSDISGPTSQRQFVFYDREGSCWRTWPVISLWGSEMFSGTWPNRGSMRSGACFEHPTWVPPINVPGCSSLLGTPTAHERTHSPRPVDHGIQLANQVALLPTPRTSDTNGTGLHGAGGMDLRTAITLLPTPRAQNGEERNSKAWPRPLDQPQNLENALARVPTVAALLPTPTRRDYKGENQRRDTPCLPGAVRSLGASTSLPSPDGNTSWDEPPLPQPTPPDGSPPGSSSG